MPGATMLPSVDDALAAGEWLSSRVVRTPVIRSTALDRIAGARVWLKAENLQRGGSYKFRGAMRAIGRLAAAGDRAGVVAQSTGNHAVAVALAAREHGMPAAVVLPVDAPSAKVALAQAYGARVILAGTTVEDRLAVVEEHRAAGYAAVDAYDHPDVICGQATATLELIDEVGRQGGRLDAVVLPVGGGGGIAGACLATRAWGGMAVHGVEPTGCDSLTRSLAGGRRVNVPPAPTLADGLRPATVGELPFRIVRESLAGMMLVDDAEIGRALFLALMHTKLLVEPSAAAALAGALKLASGNVADIGVVLTGGNVDPALVGRLIAEHGVAAGEAGVAS